MYVSGSQDSELMNSNEHSKSKESHAGRLLPMHSIVSMDPAQQGGSNWELKVLWACIVGWFKRYINSCILAHNCDIKHTCKNVYRSHKFICWGHIIMVCQVFKLIYWMS